MAAAGVNYTMMKHKITAALISLVAVIAVGVASPAFAAECGDTPTQLVACDSETGVGTINDLISLTINVLTVIIGIVATGGIAYAAIIYASARDNQSQVSQAIDIVRNIVIGIILYGFTIAIINWLVPGGVIGGGTTDETESSEQTPAETDTPTEGEQEGE
jgi:heme/copper-type cytochrome/quinol oxidase subunit 2